MSPAQHLNYEEEKVSEKQPEDVSKQMDEEAILSIEKGGLGPERRVTMQL